jgi:hypothetical protein
MGTDEVGYSNVTKTESWRGWGFGRGACGPGDISASSLETSRIKGNSPLLKPVRPPSFAQI